MRYICHFAQRRKGWKGLGFQRENKQLNRQFTGKKVANILARRLGDKGTQFTCAKVNMLS